MLKVAYFWMAGNHFARPEPPHEIGKGVNKKYERILFFDSLRPGGLKW
jgi:hypothetical protein